MQINEFDGGGQYATVWAMLIQMYWTSIKAVEKTLSKLGISFQEYGLLWVLAHHPSAPTQADLARWLVRETHSVSGLISRMEARGLVSRRKDEHNLRFTRVSMTPKGKQLYERANGTRVGAKLLSCFSDAELEQFEKLVRKLRKSASKRLGAKSVVFKASEKQEPADHPDGKGNGSVQEPAERPDQPQRELVQPTV